MTVSGYGVMISLGVLSAVLSGYVFCRKLNEDYYDLLIFASYAALFGMAGAKLLYLIQNMQEFRWDLLRNWTYVRQWLAGGFVFYGGLLGAILGGYLAVKIHKIPASRTIRVFLPLFSMLHGFGRVGCALAGCCFGINYSGIMAVTYHRSLFAPNGVPLFPIQATEALLLFAISAVLTLMLFRGAKYETMIFFYLISYGIGRFLLEFLRGDSARKTYGAFSTSQWISLLILSAVSVVFFVRFFKNRNLNRRKAEKEFKP